MKKNLCESNLFKIDYESAIAEDVFNAKRHVDIFFNSLSANFKDIFGDILNTVKCIELDIALMQADGVQSINKEYRGIDKPTNVLSFQNYLQEELKDFNEQVCYLGSIVICYNSLVQESKELLLDKTTYLYILLTHGFLHLCGFDHKTNNQAILMKEKEEFILKALNVLQSNAKPLVDNYFKD